MGKTARVFSSVSASTFVANVIKNDISIGNLARYIKRIARCNLLSWPRIRPAEHSFSCKPAEDAHVGEQNITWNSEELWERNNRFENRFHHSPSCRFRTETEYRSTHGTLHNWLPFLAPLANSRDRARLKVPHLRQDINSLFKCYWIHNYLILTGHDVPNGN